MAEIAAEEIESILKAAELAELKPGVTYLLVMDRQALPEQAINKLQNAFLHQGLKVPIIIRKWSGEFKLYGLEKEAAWGR